MLPITTIGNLWEIHCHMVTLRHLCDYQLSTRVEGTRGTLLDALDFPQGCTSISQECVISGASEIYYQRTDFHG